MRYWVTFYYFMIGRRNSISNICFISQFIVIDWLNICTPADYFIETDVFHVLSTNHVPKELFTLWYFFFSFPMFKRFTVFCKHCKVQHFPSILWDSWHSIIFWSTLHKIKFSLRISLVKMFSTDLVTFTEEILNGKLYIFCAVQ